jgi:hypothetical protein
MQAVAVVVLHQLEQLVEQAVQVEAVQVVVIHLLAQFQVLQILAAAVAVLKQVDQSYQAVRVL